MNKIQKILAGAFLAGVLLGGIGTGVALSEFSSFTYAGRTQIGAANLTTKELDFSYDTKKGTLVLAPFYWQDSPSSSRIQTDSTVPRGTVRYLVTYNDETVDPLLLFHEYQSQEEADGYYAAQSNYQDGGNRETPKQGYLELYPNYIRDDFSLCMEIKDQFLSEFQQKKISSYDVLYITDVQIKINPLDQKQITE